MKDLERNALNALRKHYCRILLINRKLDSYYPIVLEDNEQKWDKVGCLSDFARWFSNNGNIYEQDKPLFEKWIKECMIEKKNTHLFYRRRSGDEYRWAYIFIEQGEVEDEEYLYVRDVNDVYISQCDIILDSVGDIDALTGLKNSYAYNIERNNEDTVTYVYVKDLDLINSKNGFEAGDELIVSVAETLSKLYENVYRISGGVFAILNCNNKNALKENLNGIATIK